MSDIVFLYVTAKDDAEATQIARTLVDEKLAACVNILGAFRSIYRWEGAVEEAGEVAFIVKTTKDIAEHASDRIAQLHCYDTPCVAALDIADNGSNKAFLAWIGKNVEQN